MATIYANRPNFLASEVGLVLKTSSTYLSSGEYTTTSTVGGLVTEVDANGLSHSILKAGALYNGSKVKGLVFQDVDLTGSTSTNKVAIPVMVAGYYIAANLTEPPSDGTTVGETTTGATTPTKAALEAQGLHAVEWVAGTEVPEN